MGAATDPYAARTFEEFWPHYVRMHAHPETQRLHALATLSALSLVAAALALRKVGPLLAAPLVDHAIAQASHRIYERNVTRPWKKPLWHARAELRMFRLVALGRMEAETSRCSRTS